MLGRLVVKNLTSKYYNVILRDVPQGTGTNIKTRNITVMVGEEFIMKRRQHYVGSIYGFGRKIEIF